MGTSATKAVDKIIADLSARLEKAKRLREFIDDPELASELEKAFSNGQSADAEPPTVGSNRRKPTRPGAAPGLPRDGSQAWKILEYFRGHGNQPAQVRDVADAIGVPRTAAGAYIYGKGKHLFERIDAGISTETGRRRVDVRVRSEAMEAFAEGRGLRNEG
jgi:hypothetical protein